MGTFVVNSVGFRAEFVFLVLRCNQERRRRRRRSSSSLKTTRKELYMYQDRSQVATCL